MKKLFQSIRKILVPGDLIPIVVIIFGLLIAITISEEAIRLIGGSITILGVVALFMLISARLKNMVEPRNQPGVPPPKFQIRETKESGATHQIFEDFESSFDAEDPVSNAAAPSPAVTREQSTGLEIIKKAIMPGSAASDDKPAAGDQATVQAGLPSDLQPELPPEAPAQAAVEAKPGDAGKQTPAVDKKAPAIGYDASEPYSSVKIIGVVPKSPRQAPTPSAIAPKPIATSASSPAAKATTGTKNPPTGEIYKETVHSLSESETEPRDQKPVLSFDDHADDLFDDDLSAAHGQAAPKAEVKPPRATQVTRTVSTLQPPPMQEKSSTYKELKFEVPLSAMRETEQMLGQEPRKELQYFLSRVLVIIRSVTNTRTAAFLFINMEKQELILEAYVSDVASKIRPNPKLPIGNDVVSQIIANVRPEILTDIDPSAELDLIPYYAEQVGISSFIGVPVFYNGGVIGILCADTAIADAYDAVTVNFFGHFAKIIGSLVQSYTEKYDLLQASRTLEIINRFRQIVDASKADEQAVIRAITESAGSLCEWQSIGLVAFDEAKDYWCVKYHKTKDKSPALQGKAINLKRTLIGNSIVGAKTVIVAPVPNDIIRLYPGEAPPPEGFFAAFPLKSIAHNYGALFLEGRSKSGINSNDIKIMETICEHAGTAIEQLYFNNMMASSAMIDSSTGLMNPPAFVQRIEEELQRSGDFGSQLHLCLFQIDKYASFDPKQYSDRLQHVVEHVIKIAKKHIRPYDAFGRVDGSTFGIVLSGGSLDQVRLWAERLRSEVAISVLEINKQRFTVTISLGLAAAGKDPKVYGLLDNARRVLDMSAKKTNSLTVFS